VRPQVRQTQSVLFGTWWRLRQRNV